MQYKNIGKVAKIRMRNNSDTCVSVRDKNGCRPTFQIEMKENEKYFRRRNTSNGSISTTNGEQQQTKIQ